MPLSEDQKAAFDRDGFVVVRQVIDPARDIGPVLKEYQEILDGLFETAAVTDGVTSTHTGLPFAQRYLALVSETGNTHWQHFAPALVLTDKVDDNTPLAIGPALYALLRHTGLTDLLQSLLGPEITSNPGQKQRFKLPVSALPEADRKATSSATVGWHQDSGAIPEEAEGTELVTAWIPLNEATELNGCLQVIPGSHRQGTLPHVANEEVGPIPGIAPGTFDDSQARSLPMKPGDVLIINRHVIHRSLPNITDSEMRLSLDLRFQTSGQPTGYDPMPALKVRSTADPASVAYDYWGYRRAWFDARAQLAQRKEALGVRQWATSVAP